MGADYIPGSLFDGESPGHESISFGSPSIRLTELNDQNGVLLGFGIGKIFNPGCIGIAGFNGIFDTVEISYGGVTLGTVINHRHIVNFTAYTLIGAGILDHDTTDIMDKVWIVEPTLEMNINLTKEVKTLIGVSYRYVGDVELDGYTKSNVSHASLMTGIKVELY